MWANAFLLLVVVGSGTAATLLALIAAAKGKRRAAGRAALGAGLVTTGYVLLVVGTAAFTPDRALPMGEEKYICELDCHLAYSITSVRRRADSLFVRVQVRFDPASLGAGRPDDTPLYPGPRLVRLLDEHGRQYPPLSLGDLRRTLWPGQRYETELVFDVGGAAPGLVLYIADADPAKMVLLGSDNAPFRRPLGFRLSGN